MVELDINGQQRTFDVADEMPLLWALRDGAGMTGTKFGCGMGLCGACTVHVDGAAARACTLPIASVAASRITTIEQLSASRVGRALQAAWLDREVVQCGYCQSGQLMSAAALLAQNATPSAADVDAAMGGNLCRCGTYPRIREAVLAAASALNGSGG